MRYRPPPIARRAMACISAAPMSAARRTKSRTLAAAQSFNPFA